MKFIITTGHCDHEGQPPKPSDKTIEIIFGNVWRGPIGDIADAEREAWDAKETPEGAQAKADAAQQAATATAAEALKSHADDAEIHKTSKQIRADIVDADIPMTIARTMDVDADIATALDKAKAYTDDAVAGKAEAEATSTALAGKVDKVDGAGLMTDEEREKLAGIEADANAYVLPTASAEVLGGIKVGNNLSMREDGTLDAEAGGGGTVTVSPDAGNTLEQRENGLFVPAGSGGSGGGGESSVLVLPYVAPDKGAINGSLNNSADFITAWGPIIAKYLAAPNSYSLYMEVDDGLGGGGKCKIPCTLFDVAADDTTNTYYLIGCLFVEMPGQGGSLTPAKLAAVLGLICSKDHSLTDIIGYYEDKMTELNGGASAGMDYSSLEEQEVPGEFWRSLIDGQKKQVYCRTFVGTADNKPSGGSLSTPLVSGIEYAMPVAGYLMLRQGTTDMNGDSFRLPIGQVIGGQGFSLICSNVGGVSGAYVSQNIAPDDPLPFVLTIKYIKQ